MPTLLLKNGFKFFFYVNEHEPKHIHVAKGGNFAKIDLKTFEVSKKFMEPGDLKKAISIIKEHQKEFERKWNEYFNKR